MASLPRSSEAPPKDVDGNESSSFVLNSTLRFTLLRTTLVLALVVLSEMIQGLVACQSATLAKCIETSDVIYISGTVIVFVHQFLSAFGPRFSLPGIMDLVLLVAVPALILRPLVKSWRLADFLRVQIFAYNDLIYYFSIWALALMVLLLASHRIAVIVKMGPKNLLTRVDVPMSAGSRRSTPTEILFGRTIWRSQFLNERRWLILFRGVVTLLCLFAITAFAITKVLLQPLGQLSITSVKDLRMSAPHPIFLSDMDVVVRHFGGTAHNLIDAVTVTKRVYGIRETACSSAGTTNFQVFIQVVFNCGRSSPISGYEIPLQLDIAVNFTVLLRNNQQFDGVTSPVQLQVGLTNNTEIVAAQTPILLVPGLNAIGQAVLTFQQRYRTPSGFTLGLFNSLITYCIAEIAHIYNNPITTSAAPDASFIRIYLSTFPPEFRMTQDYSESTVLNGFSATGGLWNFFGSIIALLFGRTILQSIFGFKPLSFFGLLHSWGKGRIREGYREKYPRLASDLSTDSREQGLLSLIRDLLLDVDMFSSSQPKGEDEVEHGKIERSGTLAILPPS